jgi:hypothetical protein
MSKNDHMLSPTILTVGASRATAGAVSLAQGVYGARGNLELVACDATDGLWVFWFNANLDGDPIEAPDVPPGSWSAGLHFASGHRYVDAQIVQSTLGPDHLEVLALADDGVLQSWYWSPGPGFQRRATDAATGVTVFHLVHADGTLRVTADDRHLVSTPDDYPDREWTDAPSGPGAVPEVAPPARVAASGVELGTVRIARSNRLGGTTEYTWRDRSGRIRHLGVQNA